ncbi:transglutaminase-like cysteine peptidase [Roseinatronobacter sp.]
MGALSAIMTITSATAGQAPQRRASIDQSFNFVPRRPMLAHVRFCKIYASQCDIYRDRRPHNRSPQDDLNAVIKVNWSVNRAITPVEEIGFDSWDINVAQGDCEDFALQKHKELIALGWPTDALRLAVTRTPRGTVHAVLLVTINGSDFVLDNLSSRVLRWHETPYEFLIIQDKHDPKAWHDIIIADLTG